MKSLFVTIIIFIYCCMSFAGGLDTLRLKNQNLKIFASRIGQPVILDGVLNEAFWQKANGVDSFVQRDPNEGVKPTQNTVVKIVYDDAALYVGAEMYDSSPDSIIARLARKDFDTNSDAFIVFLDPYNDKRSGYYFGISSAGTLYDGTLYNDEWDDDTWDGVWEGKATINKKGWSAEIRIPFSQLKFQNGNHMVWGVNFRRDIARRNERDYIVYTPRNESGFVSRFPDLRGISDIKSSSRIELLPYITGKAQYLQHESGDPFNDGSKYSSDFGLDLKMGIGTNLTLNGTINPDFGQVEIDPAVINLSDVETFFSEKRPFFVEGSSIFEFGYGGSRSNWSFNFSTPDFFYSRRIGRTPQGSTPDADYNDFPDGTHILGAAKLTGKLGDTWNVGTIQSITNREYVRQQTNDIKSKTEIEPLAYYGVFRAQKEIDEGRQGIGFISTITARDFKDNRLRNEINASAITGGIDGWTFLDSSKTYVVTGWFGGSRITGTTQRMIDLQQSSRHYLQRPDAKNFSVDSTATSMSGYASRFTINKQKGNVIFNSALGVISPRFDVNDLGFLWRADVINMHVGGGYAWRDPTDYFRSFQLIGAVFRSYDFDGNITWEGVWQDGYYEFLNYYSLEWVFAYNPETVNNRRTRGGPLTLNHKGTEFDLFANSDNRKSWVVSLGSGTYLTEDGDYYYANVGLEVRPLSNISISFSPSFEKGYDKTQWIGAFDDLTATKTFGKRYVFGEIEQTTLSASIRLNWTFNPQLSLQVYIQPLISSGKYTNFKELARPKSYDYTIYGTNGSTIDENNIADPDGSGPAPPIEIGNPDFNYTSLRGNAVLRWEYLPGSVLYFVWTQTRENSEDNGNFNFNNSFKHLGNSRPDNIFMLKFTYWFNM
jgi:hypothetical protein